MCQSVINRQLLGPYLLWASWCRKKASISSQSSNHPLFLPVYSKARRLMLQRLLQWAPVNFGSYLAQRLCTELSREDYLSVNADEVGIMLTKPGLLYNQALLDR